MKIIVTGGAGFIGSNFVHHMVNKYPDYEIINLDLLTYAGNLENLKPVEDKPNYKFVKGDIADRKFIFELFEKEKPDVVVNFAAESHVDRSITDPEAFVRTMSWEPQPSLTPVVPMASSAIIRFPPMRCTATCLLTDRTFSLQRKRPCTHPALIHLPRQALICSCWHITGHTACR